MEDDTYQYLASNEPQEDSYQIVSYLGSQIPKDILPCIKKPFLETLRYGNEYFKLIDKESFWNIYPKYVDSILKKPQTHSRIAMLKDKTILGWSLIEGNILHYLWVKKELRGQGIAKSLLTREVNSFSHITNKGLSIWAKDNYKNWSFNPFV